MFANSYRIPGSFFSAMGELEAARQKIAEHGRSIQINESDMTVTLPRGDLVALLMAVQSATLATAEILAQSAELA